ncbi:MAG: flagellar basal body protein [Curvibacter sp.]|nr:flagellar basal body protein [Curvibacter sp.]
MIEGIQSTTAGLLSAALSAVSLRQQLIATNIANVDVDGYVPQTVNFDAYMRNARMELQDRGAVDESTLQEMVSAPPPIALETAANGMPAKVQLDMQVAAMAENTLRYQALLKGLSHHFSLMSLAVNDGKR